MGFMGFLWVFQLEQISQFLNIKPWFIFVTLMSSRNGSWTRCVTCTRLWQSPRLSSSSTPGEKSTGWQRKCMGGTSLSLLWYDWISCLFESTARWCYTQLLSNSAHYAQYKPVFYFLLFFIAWRHGPEGAGCDHEGIQIWLKQSVDHYWPSG